MINYPLVSVVIPAFNHEKYVIRCLESLIEDGYPNLEVLLMDDGSKDQTYKIAQDWINRNGEKFHSTYLDRQKNKGIAATLNTLIERSKGDYLTLLASDDYLLPNGIEARVLSLDDRPEWLAVIGDCIVVDENGSKKFNSGIEELHRGNKANLLNEKLIKTELIIKWSIPGPVMLVRRKAFDQKLGVGKYDETLHVEDRDYYLRLLAKNALGFINVNVSAYRMHKSNLSSNNQLNVIIAAIFRDLASSCKKNKKLFKGIDRFTLTMQSIIYKYKAKYTETNLVAYKIATSILSCISNLFHFAIMKILR
jgi:glycosyltransferase involved in cell wall biosynthesis